MTNQLFPVPAESTYQRARRRRSRSGDSSRNLQEVYRAAFRVWTAEDNLVDVANRIGESSERLQEALATRSRGVDYLLGTGRPPAAVATVLDVPEGFVEYIVKRTSQRSGARAGRDSSPLPRPKDSGARAVQGHSAGGEVSGSVRGSKAAALSMSPPKWHRYIDYRSPRHIRNFVAAEFEVGDRVATQFMSPDYWTLLSRAPWQGELI